jgi:DNA-binding MltR family transcriptional regulator
MAASRNRGKRKPKLRDLSLSALTTEEITVTRDALRNATDPIATAILGTAVVEYELDKLLRWRIPRNDDATWEDIVGDVGPLGTLSRKIKMGYALKLYDSTTMHNLDVIRTIRNGFAHTKKIIGFDHELVVAEIKKVRIPARGKKYIINMFTDIKNQTYSFKLSYSVLCSLLAYEMLEHRLKAALANLSRKNRKALTLRQKAEAIARDRLPPGEWPTNWLKWIQEHQIAGPIREVPPLSQTTPSHPDSRPDDNKDR